MLGRIEVGAQFITDDKGNRMLLKQAQPVPIASAAAKGRLTDPQLGVRRSFQTFANQLKRLIQRAGGSVQVGAVPVSSVPNMKKTL